MNTSALKMCKLISLPFARRLAVFPHGRSVGRYGLAGVRQRGDALRARLSAPASARRCSPAPGLASASCPFSPGPLIPTVWLFPLGILRHSVLPAG